MYLDISVFKQRAQKTFIASGLTYSKTAFPLQCYGFVRANQTKY